MSSDGVGLFGAAISAALALRLIRKDYSNKKTSNKEEKEEEEDDQLLLTPDIVLEKLQKKSKEWTMLSKQEKCDILYEIQMRSGDFGISYDISKCHMESRKVFPSSSDGDGLIGGYGVLVSLFLSTIADMYAKGMNELDKPNRKVDFLKEYNVSTTATAYDVGTFDPTHMKCLMFTSTDEGTKGKFYKNPHNGEIAVILGAGNHPILCASDALYHLFVEGRVCVIKHHPLQIGAKKALEYVLKPLIDKGYVISLPEVDLEFTKGLMYSPLTNVVHLTGGKATHDAIVWGLDGQQMSRREKNEPLLKAAMHSELGAVTPYIVLPSSGYEVTQGAAQQWTTQCSNDEWTDERVNFYAEKFALAKADNCSCNCLALTVLVLPVGDLGDRFEAAVRKALGDLKREPAWYPGMQDRYNNWLKSVKACNAPVEFFSAPSKEVGCPNDTLFLDFGVANLGIVTAADLESVDNMEARFPDMGWAREEVFAPLMSIVRVEGSTSDEFATNAFRFADAYLWGNLSCAIMAPPSVQQRAIKAVCEGEVKYGSCIINSLTQMGFLVQGYWGGPQHAKNTAQDVQSGCGGTVMNSYMFDDPRNCICLRDFNSKAGMDPPPNIGAFLSNTLARVLAKGWKSLIPWM